MSLVIVPMNHRVIRSFFGSASVLSLAFLLAFPVHADAPQASLEPALATQTEVPNPASPLPEETWIEGSTIRYLVLPYLEGGLDWQSRLLGALNHLVGVRLLRTRDKLRIEIHFDQSFTVALREKKDAKTMDLYAIEIPKVSRFSVKALEGVIQIKQSHRVTERWRLKFKLPVIADSVELDRAKLDLNTGQGWIEAGLGYFNCWRIVAKGRLADNKLVDTGVDFKSTFSRNFGKDAELCFNRWADHHSRGSGR